MSDLKITHTTRHNGDCECRIEIRWFAMSGTFLVEADGVGHTPEGAEKQARLMLGQARSRLVEVTTEERASEPERQLDVNTTTAAEYPVDGYNGYRR